MKKFLVAAMAGVLAISFAACSGDKTENNVVEESVSTDAQKTPEAAKESSAVQSIFGIDCEVGQYITLGNYEQDNNSGNGKEAIEWLVLDKVDGKALVVSRYALDCRQYNRENKAVTWATSDLRSWLNDKFLNEAFNEDEKDLILLSNVSADENPEEDTDPGEATNDKIFVLSVAEVHKYIKTTEAHCTGTAYAFAQGARAETHQGAGNRCKWWTRTPGDEPHKAAFVNFVNNPREYGQDVTNGETAVRPAMWVEAN